MWVFLLIVAQLPVLLGATLDRWEKQRAARSEKIDLRYKESLRQTEIENQRFDAMMKEYHELLKIHEKNQQEKKAKEERDKKAKKEKI